MNMALNKIPHGFSNAPSFNDKIKLLRANLHGVADPCFGFATRYVNLH